MMVDPTDSSLDKSIEQQPLQPGSRSDHELPPSTLLPAEDQQDSSSAPQLPSHSPAHPSLEPACSPPTVVDDAPSRPIDGCDQPSDPSPDVAPPSVPTPPSLPPAQPLHEPPPSPSDHSHRAQSPVAPPAQQSAEPEAPAAVSAAPAEHQSRLSSSPKPSHTALSPPPAAPPTTTASVAAASLPPSSPAAEPTAAHLLNDHLPTPPVSDCSPPQLDSIDCIPESHPLPTHSPPPTAGLLAVDQPTQRVASPTVDSALPLPEQPSFSSPSPPASTEQPPALDPPDVTRQSPPPPPPLPTSVSVNSLSPLSDLPSAHSPSRAVGSPVRRSQSVLSPHPSPVSTKRQASPSMYENGVHLTEGSPAHVNGNSLHTNGQSAPKRPRMANESSSNPPTHTTLLNSSTTTPFHPQQAHPPTTANPPQSTAEPMGLVPGHPGTRLTKDQHRFAISVIKQLKKHRSSGPFVAPVDPVKLNIPDYFSVVTHPMDLGTIETRLGKVGKPCYYRSVQDFISDVQQVFTNCYLYNGPPAASPYSKMATELSNQFDTHLNKMPPDEPIYPTASRSPSMAKLQSKVKPAGEFRPSPPVAKRKNASPMGNSSSLPAGQAGTGQKRRSISPQHPRKKTSKATSLPGPAFPDGNGVNSQIAWRASINDPSSSQRARADARDQYHIAGQYHTHSVTEPPTVSNSKAELKFCKDILREVNKKVYDKFVWPFYEPVDIVKLGIPDYPKFVKKPMDLETMKNKLARGEYPNGAAFAEDFRLMLKNCYAFNPPSSTYYHCGKQLESLFEAKWTERPPAEIPASLPPPVASTVEPPVLDPIQVLQMQVAQLQERINVEVVKARGNSLHAIPGTGPPKKQSHGRGTAQSKSVANPSTSAPLVPGVAAPPAPKTAKANSAGPAKPKQNNGGARRKSAGTTLTPAVKPQPQPYEQSAPDRQYENPEQALQSYQMPPSALPAYPLEPSPAPPPVANLRVSEPDYFEKIDYEQKKDLAIQIQNAVEPMQSDAINLIRTSRPDLVPPDGEEIELDIDALDDRTLYLLYQLVCAPPPPPPKGKKNIKGTTNGKPKAAPRRKPAPGAVRKSSTTAPPTYTTTAAQIPGVVQEAEVPPHAWPHPVPQAANGHSNGTKPKPIKKPRAPAAAPRRKGIDETQEAARIKELEEKLHKFDGYPDTQPALQNNHMNGVSSTTPALGLALNEPPPAGPVEYASSSSESESETDDDSD